MKKFFLPLIFLIMMTGQVAAEMRVKKGVPKGFEDLADYQQTAITIYYGGDIIGNFPASFKPGFVKLADPAAVIERIGNVKDRALLENYLSGEVPANAALICKKQNPACGILEPETAGLIFNENNLSAEIFINKKHLETAAQTRAEFLPLPANGFSSVYGISGALSGIDDNKPNFAVTAESLYSYNEKRLESVTSVSDKGARLDVLQAGIEREGWGGSAGLFRSRPMQLLGDADIAGVGIYTSNRTVIDKRKTEGNDVIIYLPRRAYISIYREGRLYSSRLYDAGNQKIDTSELPEGAYNILLKVQEPDGNLREETRFFAKSPDIPPPGRPVYYAEGGLVRKPANEDSAIPEVTTAPLVRAGTMQRMRDNMGLSANVALLDDRMVAEGGSFFVLDGAKLNANAMISSRGDAGAQAGYFYYIDKVSAALDARKLWVNKDAGHEYAGLLTDITQATASVSYGVDEKLYIGARGSYSKTSYTDASTSFGPYAEWRIWQDGESRMALNADVARNNKKNEGSLIMRFTHKIGSYGVSGTTGQGFGNNGGAFANARGWYEENEPGRYLEVGTGVNADSKTRSAGADAYWRGSYGQARGSVQQSSGEREALSYGGNFSFGAAQGGGEVFIGGERLDKSAIAISTKGDAKGKMRVFINGSEYSGVNIGGSQVVYLSPFQTYSVQLKPEGDGMFDYDGNVRKVTLYPGNVARMEWNVNRYYVIAAKIVDANGAALANAKLQNSKAGITTDEKGNLQAELAGKHDIEFRSGDIICKVKLPDTADDNGIIIYPDALVCN